MNFNRTTPQEKVYLHFDNTGYFKNESIWFKAYVVRTDSGVATDLSKVLYVELINPRGDVIELQKLPIDSLGQANGSFHLKEVLSTGFYEVRAYTRYMTNWGVDACFSRVFPIFHAPKKEGDYTDLTLDVVSYRHRVPNLRSVPDSVYLKAKKKGLYTQSLAKKINVSFYPEGGDLVKGKKCKVAMLIVDDNGFPYKGEGYITNESDDVYAVVQSDSLGRGVFEVIPDGTDLFLRINNRKNKAQSYKLPKAKDEGCALSIDAINSPVKAKMQFTDGICGQMFGYALMHNGNIVYCDTLTSTSCNSVVFDRDSLSEGVNQFIVFDSRGRVFADRLFFICPKAQSDETIKFVSKSDKISPCCAVELELQSTPNSNLSFSAVDYRTMNNGKQGNMKTWMLLSSEVKGYIHNVDYYFEADDNEHRQSADLLMLTQGWRRYVWELMTEQCLFANPQPIEDGLYVDGSLLQYRKWNKSNGVKINTYLYNESGESLIGETVTDSLGHYGFSVPNVDGEWAMQMFTRIKNKRKTFYVGINRQFAPSPRYITSNEAKPIKRLRPNLIFNYVDTAMYEADCLENVDKNYLLENVEVKAKKRYFVNDDFMYRNESFGKAYASVFYDADKELDHILDLGKDVPTVLKFTYSKLGVDTERMYNYNDYIPGLRVKWIIDNNEHSFEPPVDFLDEVKSIYIVFNGKLPNNLRMEDYFKVTQYDFIYVYIYRHTSYTTASQKGLRRTYFQGFNKPSTFKMEDYSVLPPMADFRRTIYWNPNVRTDAQGKAQVKFYNNSTCEEMYISAEGMSEEGKVLISQ